MILTQWFVGLGEVRVGGRRVETRVNPIILDQPLRIGREKSCVVNEHRQIFVYLDFACLLRVFVLN